MRLNGDDARGYWVKKLVLLAALTSAMSTAQAADIKVELGPATRVIGEKTVSFDSLNNLLLSGQTLSLDFVFAEGEFIRLPVSKRTKVTGTGFSFQPMLKLLGAGTVKGSVSTGYLFDRARKQIGEAQKFDSPSVRTTLDGEESVRFPLGYVSPFLSQTGMTSPVDIYGAHFEVTLPNAPEFRVTGGELGLFANGSKPWNNQFEIRNGFAKSGGTLKRGERSRRGGAKARGTKPNRGGSAVP